ncbi:MAG: hypothetical protein R6U35_04535 [Candidatus Humimicrobiaceae bacterium]
MADWAVGEAMKVSDNKDMAILENPENKEYLDHILVDKFWPDVKESLEDTGYGYWPKDIPGTEFEFRHELTRSLTFMAFGYERAMFRGKLECSMSGWMLKSEFFMGLARETSPSVIFEILGNPWFKGNPPTLEIYEDILSDYFHITFSNGQGAGWGLGGFEAVQERIWEIIDGNIELYEFTLDGHILREELEDFFLLARRIYEAY